MEDWIGIILLVAYLLYEVFSRVFNWRPEVKEPNEEDKQLDELFGEPEPEGVEPRPENAREAAPPPRRTGESAQPPPVPAQQKSPDQELMEALGLPAGAFQEKKQPPPPPQKKMPPVRPPSVPAQASTQATPQPNFWEQQLAQQKEQRRRQANSRENDLARRFEQQAQKKSLPAQATTVADISNLHDLLRSPASARQAIVLREVLGPAPGLAPAAQPRESNTPFI